MSPFGNIQRSEQFELPLIIAGEFLVFPEMRFPYFSSQSETVEAIKAVLLEPREEDRLAFFAYPIRQRSSEAEEPSGDRPESTRLELHRIGTVVRIIQTVEPQDGSVRFTAEAQFRASILKVVNPEGPGARIARVTPVVDNRFVDAETSLLMDAVKDSFDNLQTYHRKIPKELFQAVRKADYPDKLINLITPALSLRPENKLELLQMTDRTDRLRRLSIAIETEIAMLKLQGDIQAKVRERVEQAQKEYFLNEQIKQIHKELGHSQEEIDEPQELFDRIAAKTPPQEVLDKAIREADRLRKLQPMSPESGVIRTYLEWLADIPWKQETQDLFDLERARRILDEDHYNMERAKQRILDFIAVKALGGSLKSPILCLVGPPGTGKTSLGKSIARTLGRSFVRISLGGVRDEAEIRGHRKTYVGALPGRIIQSMKRVETINPVFLLDEVDKLGADFRGDPSSALLEVLDPEQNSTFADHYLEVHYDLSRVLFIATANSLHTIPAALRDRMEIIEIPGYSDQEKYEIAVRYLIPRQLTENGLGSASINFTKDSVYRLIHEYTMESGVRSLERTIGSVIRKLAREVVAKHADNGSLSDAIGSYRRRITPASIQRLIGRPLHTEVSLHDKLQPGVANGLAWTEMGGRLLTVETVLIPGDGKLILTGNLGEVMKESARIALSYLQSNSKAWGIPQERIDSHDIHIHVPQGAIPKDGPSAGITITSALISLFTDRPVRQDVSMTGEVTLTGRVLAIGGVKEKVLASFRHGIHSVILPADNERDAQEDIPSSIRDRVTIHYVKRIEEVLDLLLTPVAKKGEERSHEDG